VKIPDDLIPEQWYAFELTAKQNMFTVKYGFVEDPDNPPDYTVFPIGIVAEDFEFVGGDVGFYTDGMSGACFDALEVDPLPCKINTNSKKKCAISFIP
jgi:hypothetical protein